MKTLTGSGGGGGIVGGSMETAPAQTVVRNVGLTEWLLIAFSPFAFVVVGGGETVVTIIFIVTEESSDE